MKKIWQWLRRMSSDTDANLIWGLIMGFVGTFSMSFVWNPSTGHIRGTIGGINAFFAFFSVAIILAVITVVGEAMNEKDFGAGLEVGSNAIAGVVLALLII